MGVAEFAHEQGGWDFIHPNADKNGEVFLPKNWKGDGIIGRVSSEKLRDQVIDVKLPVVNVSWLPIAPKEILNVVSDQAACGQLAAEYLLDRDYRNIGYIGPPPWQGYTDAVPDGIQSTLDSKGLKLDCFQFPDRRKNEIQIRKALGVWVSTLEKPAAFIVWSSTWGHLLSAACFDLNLSIPKDVAIICIENDELASSLARIPLSHLDQDGWNVGYRAARCLLSMMVGSPPRLTTLLIPPLSVVQRRSTEASAVSDPVVREAYRLIHEYVAKGLNVAELARRLGTPRRTLEKRFQICMGITPSTGIRRARLTIAKRLLRETTLTIHEIATRSGFSRAEVLVRTFKKETGQTPTQFRSPGF